MEDLTRSWNKFSLSKKEEKGVDLFTNKQIQYVCLVAKFFTRRTVNIDAVVRTFCLLWRTSKDFRIRDAGKNHLVFEFEDWEDAEKVLLGEPWSFDRSLIVFQRIDGGKSLGRVTIPPDEFELQGGDFMRSKGSLRMEDQKFGSWLRASQFNPSRKTVVEVKGFSNLQHSTNFSEMLVKCSTEIIGEVVKERYVDQAYDKPSVKETALDNMDVLGSKRKNLGLLNEAELVVDKDKKVELPWMAIGDFNELVGLSEKEGGGCRPTSHMARFSKTIDWCGFRDAGFVGPKFTWLYQKNDGTQIRERLDRALATEDWMVKFPSTKLYHLSSSVSDHCPLSLHLFRKAKKQRIGQIFKFEFMWLKDPRCEEVVNRAWVDGLLANFEFSLSKCLELCRSSLDA
uniref:DUF4283 domain-containing protein n=1 Tax=Quercus lobata TaxID=97700 RepID=A0A7N2M4M2_QUELO